MVKKIFKDKDSKIFALKLALEWKMAHLCGAVDLLSAAVDLVKWLCDKKYQTITNRFIVFDQLSNLQECL